MKKLVVFFVLGLFVFGAIGIAAATPFQEEFLFGIDGQPLTGWFIGKDRWAEADFNLAGAGGEARQVHISGNVLDTRMPSGEATGYVPHSNLDWARLNLKVGSTSSMADPIFVLARFQSNDELVFQSVLHLTDQWTELEFDLPGDVLAELQSTGGLSTLTISPYWVNYEIFPDNGFILHEMELTAAYSVPEPSTLLFLLCGLVGVVGLAGRLALHLPGLGSEADGSGG